jgi:prepilin-type N-terminal cleavage/methylation domain-containing protein/prepilin-type processing-associated H-X9-DG protein
MFSTRETRIVHSSRKSSAFTLVELLVVIGIIAVLISILLPTLSSARQAANATKCAAALREIGNAFQMYAGENKGYYPPMRAICAATTYRITFSSVPPVDFSPTPGVQQDYWMYFLAKYVSKGKFAPGAGATNADIAHAIASVLWGCPNFTPVNVNAGDSRAVGNIAVVYTGYGMNGFPAYTATYPPVPDPADSLAAIGDTSDANACSGIDSTTNWKTITRGTWYKQKAYTSAADRALVGDCRAYVLEAIAPGTGANTFTGQPDVISLGTGGQGFWLGGGAPTNGQSSYDYYRHGRYPSHQNGAFALTGGKILYNILYADGHVKGAITREEGFKAARMRFPG